MRLNSNLVRNDVENDVETISTTGQRQQSFRYRFDIAVSATISHGEQIKEMDILLPCVHSRASPFVRHAPSCQNLVSEAGRRYCHPHHWWERCTEGTAPAGWRGTSLRTCGQTSCPGWGTSPRGARQCGPRPGPATWSHTLSWGPAPRPGSQWECRPPPRLWWAAWWLPCPPGSRSPGWRSWPSPLRSSCPLASPSAGGDCSPWGCSSLWAVPLSFGTVWCQRNEAPYLGEWRSTWWEKCQGCSLSKGSNVHSTNDTPVCHRTQSARTSSIWARRASVVTSLGIMKNERTISTTASSARIRVIKRDQNPLGK